MTTQLAILLILITIGSGIAAEQDNEGGGVASCNGSGCPGSITHQDAPSFRPKSCLDYLRKGEQSCGVYKIYDNAGQSFPVYCDMNSEPGNAWTLVTSWSMKHRAMPAFQKTPLNSNAPVNENAPNWNLYRLTKTRMESLKSHSTHWRATCSFQTDGVDYTDYVRGNFNDFDIMTFLGSGICKRVELINIRGHMAVQQTAKFWAVANTYSLHVDSSAAGCFFVPTSGSVSSEDNFGFYGAVNPRFRCTAGPQATTQWWFGGHL